MKTNYLTPIFIIMLTLTFILPMVSANPEYIANDSSTQTWILAPSGDTTGQTDGDNIQAAIDAASSGDTILLKAGTFYLGKYLAEDTSWVSTSRGEFLWITDYYNYDIRKGPEPFPQVIVVNKPLTIMGENSADSENPMERTIITVANTWMKHGVFSLIPDANMFVIDSTGVTIKNLRLQEMINGFRVISAGSTIEDNIFDTCGWALEFNMDDYSPYPNYPSFTNPVKSYMRRNQWLNAIHGPHLYGSEIVVSENYIETRLSSTVDVSFTMWGMVFGGMPEEMNIPDIFSQSLCRNNLVENNVIEGDENSIYGAFYFSGYGPPIIENKIIHNTVRNMWAMVESWGWVPVEGNIISYNVAEGVGYGLYSPGYGVVFDGGRYIPKNNIISQNQFIDTLYPMVLFAGEENQLILNDYRGSNRLGWDFGDGCIYLGGWTANNYVLEVLFPATTTMHDQILNFGFENRIVGFPRH